ncbi:helix-turn-helix transcriptional regulator [Mycoplasmatota bacterium WC44]
MLYDKVEIGKRLKELREESNMTQDEAAKLINISNRTLSDWEKGKIDFSIQRLREISDAFNISINYFIPFEYEDFDVDEIIFKSLDFGIKKYGLFTCVVIFITFYLNLFFQSTVLNTVIIIEFILFCCYIIILIMRRLTSRRIIKKYSRKNSLIYQSVYSDKELRNLHKDTVGLIVLSIFISLFSATCIIGFYFSETIGSYLDTIIVFLFILVFVWGLILLGFFIKAKPLKPILDYFRENQVITVVILNAYIVLISMLFMYGLVLNTYVQTEVPKWVVITIYTYLLVDILLLLTTSYIVQKYYHKLDIISVNPKTNQLKILFSVNEKIPETPEHH